MFGGSLVVRLVCLLWFLSRQVCALDRTTYINKLRGGLAGRNLRRRNAFYSNYLRTNNSWQPKINPMAFSYNRANKWNHLRRRQDIYGGSDYDWEGYPVEDTPTWPPDYNSWPQTATQAPPQVLPQAPQLVPTQAPFQVPTQTPFQVPFQPSYQVPSAVPTQMGVPYEPQLLSQARPSFSPAQTQKWTPRVKPKKYMKSPIKLEARNALRVCSPGPPLGANPLFRNCLVIGDSISLGYLTTVKGQLQGLCQVQHAPFAKGSGAVDSRYGLQCLSMMLHTTALEPTSYDAIVFNFGMHDINYSKMFPEEFVSLEEYGQNLMKIKELLLESGAQVAFALTTPVPIAGRRNERVVAYNKEARRVMEDGKRVEIVDLHSAVIHECGEPPYETCSIMKRPRDVHFNPKGNKLLGVKVGATFRSLLSKAKPRGKFSPPKAPERSAREGLASSYLHDDTSSFCPDMVTRCPAWTTCCENLLSLTGYGCCMEPDAVNCPDNWHCCPRGSHCSPNCNFRSCKCLFPSAHPVAAAELNKEAKGNKTKSKSQHGSHSAGGKPAKEAKNRKVVPKADKKKKKNHKAIKDKGRKKSPKKASRKSKHKLKMKDKKNKDHKQSRKEKGRKKTHKAKDKGSKSEKMKKLKKTKAIQKMNKHVVKAHKTHQKTNFHPTTKQHWVTMFNESVGVLKKHKPNIKFSHTWGKRKHQKLTYKSNGNKNNRLETDASMADELNHLIVNHRKQKLRARLKLPVDGNVKHLHDRHRHVHGRHRHVHDKHRHMNGKYRHMNGKHRHMHGKQRHMNGKHRHMNGKHRHMHGRQRHRHGRHRNVLIDQREPGKRKKQKETTIHPTGTKNFFKQHNSKFLTRNKKPAHGVKASNKIIKNPNGHTEKALGHENRVTVNVFNNLRQALHEKLLAKENMSLELNSPIRQNGKNVEHLADVVTKNTTENLEKSKSESSLKTQKITGSVEHHQRTSPKEKMSSNIDKKKQDHVNLSLKKISGNGSSNASTNMSEGSQTSNSSSADITSITKGGELNNPATVSVSNVVVKGKSLNTDEGETRGHSLIILKPNTSDSGVDERTTRQNQNKLEYFGKDVNGTKQMLTTIGANNVSNADNDRTTDGVASGNGLEADEYFIGSASGFETSTSVSGGHDESDDSNIHEHIKVFLGGENIESSTNDLEKYEVMKGLPSMDLSPAEEGLTNVGDGLHKTSSLTNVSAESDEADATSGSSFETLSQEPGSSLDFGGEGIKGLPSMDLSPIVESSTNEADGLYKTLTNVNAESDLATTSDSDESGSGLHFGGEFIKGRPSMDLSPVVESATHFDDALFKTSSLTNVDAKSDKAETKSGFEESGSGLHFRGEVIKGLPSMDSLPVVESSTTVGDALYKSSSLAKVNAEFDEAETISGSEESGGGLQFGGEAIKGLPSMDSSSVESSTTINGLYKTSSLTNVDVESDGAITSGSGLATLSDESGSGLHFGGEGDDDDAIDEEEMSYSNRDDINQSGLFPSSRTTSFKQNIKRVGDEQSVEHQNGDFFSGSSPDISQIRYNDWDDVEEAYSGFESGHYESSSDEWGRGEYGSSSESLSIDAKASSVKNHTTANTSNIANSLYQNGGDVDGERNKNEMPSAGEDTKLERRNQIHGSTTGNRKRLSEEKRFRIKSLRRKPPEKAKDVKTNDFKSSWEDKELQQLLYWLSTNDNQNNRFKQAQKDMWRLHNIHQTWPESTKEYSRIQDMLLQKIFPNFSQRKREEFEERYGNGERTFRADTPDSKFEQIMQRQEMNR